MTKRNICIIGNSVALRVRPIEKYPNNLNYSQILQKKFSVSNLALGAQTVKELYKDLDIYIREFPDLYIINIGVVDSSTREVPLWFYRLATKKSLNPFYVFLELFYRNIIAKIRNPLVKLRGKSSWISKKKFEKYFELIVSNLLKETNAKLIILSINEANNRIESQLPGSKNNHKIYNDIIKNITNKYSQTFIDTNKIISSTDYPDGVHFSSSGHKKIVEEINSVISKIDN